MEPGRAQSFGGTPDATPVYLQFVEGDFQRDSPDGSVLHFDRGMPIVDPSGRTVSAMYWLSQDGTG